MTRRYTPGRSMAQRKFSGTKRETYSDAGSAYWCGERIAWMPIDLLFINHDEFNAIVAAYGREQKVLSRDQVREIVESTNR